MYKMSSGGISVFSIVRKSLPALRATVMRDFFDILRHHDLYDPKYHNKTENTYLLNQNLFEFMSLDQSQIIFELRKAGYNVRLTFKGANSINTGIDSVKRFKLHVTKGSLNLIRELKNYKWKEDAMGHASNQPIDKFYHALDALRYVAMDRVRRA